MLNSPLVSIFIKTPTSTNKCIVFMSNVYVFICCRSSTCRSCAESVCSLLCNWHKINDIVNRQLKDFMMPGENKGIVEIMSLRMLLRCL